jgi:hypothetical protein
MSEGTAAVPAIPLEVLIPCLAQHCLNRRVLRLLQRDEDFQNLRFRCHQIYYINDFATSKHNIPISIGALKRAFQCSRNSVTQALVHGLEPPQTRGRHSALDAEIEHELLVWIEDNAAKNTAVTGADLRARIVNHYHLPVTRGWVNSFIGRHLDRLCKVKSTPQESSRLEVPRCFLDQTIQCLTELVQGCRVELVFNLDEVGISDWEDRQSKKVIVPVSARERAIHHKINRRLKHVSIIACISAAGESLMPYVVTSQDSLPVRDALKKRGMRFGTDLILKHHAKPYINMEIFEDYIRKVFIQNLNELRSLEEFADEEAVLLMDNCPSHVGELILSVLRDVRVRVISWPPHTTQIFQELDVSLFGVLKRKGQYKLPIEDDQGTAAFRLKTYRAFKQTMIEANIWGAFHELGFEFDTSVEPYRLLFHEEILRATPGFREIWALDFPLEKLSLRRQNAKFGWINRPE